MEDETFDMYDAWDRDFWWIRSRREVIRQTLESLDRGKASRILDIGSGSGLFYDELKGFGTVISLEYSEKGTSHLMKKGIPDVVRADAESLPFKDRSFDIVTCIDVMEHLNDDEGMIREVARVLNGGGYFIMTVPAYRFLWSDDDVLVHHKRRYTRKELYAMLSREFQVLKGTYRFFFIFFPTLLKFKINSMKRRLKGKRYELKNSLDAKPSRLTNLVLSRIMGLENALIGRGMSFPFGVNILIVARRK
jgi:SAM-dependent methyltransferase